jgi:mannose-6-phosphate isomerase
MNPVVLAPNLVPRFYRGGPAIAGLRDFQLEHERMPEEWIGSTTTVFGEPSLGLSTLPDGTLLRDAIAAEPQSWLGPAHVERFGADPALLVKLLDAGERLPVHVHPDDAFAQAHLDRRFGKTEAWLILGAEPDAAVWAGFTVDVEEATLRGWVAEQDHGALLGSLHRIDARAGGAVFVPAGTPHAISAGVLILELQQPTDLSILLEWEGFGIADEAEASLGLGWTRALETVDRGALDPAPLIGPALGDAAVASLLPAAADAFFRAERVRGPAEIDAGFAVLLATAGRGRLVPTVGDAIGVARGQAVLLPHAAGPSRIEDDLVLIACRPPATG